MYVFAGHTAASVDVADCEVDEPKAKLTVDVGTLNEVITGVQVFSCAVVLAGADVVVVPIVMVNCDNPAPEYAVLLVPTPSQARSHPRTRRSFESLLRIEDEVAFAPGEAKFIATAATLGSPKVEPCGDVPAAISTTVFDDE